MAPTSGDRHPVGLAHRHHLGRRHAQSVGDQLDRMAESDLEHAQSVILVEGLRLVGPMLLLDQLDIRFREQFSCEIAVLLRHSRGELLPGHVLLASGGHVIGHQNVDAIGLAADVRIDPIQLRLDRVRRVRGCPEHAEAARAADGGDDITTVAEGEQRELDAQRVADR